MASGPSWLASSVQTRKTAVPVAAVYHRISKFVDTFYTDAMGAVDFWYRFEWQHRESPHVHGIAWFADAPDIQHLLAAEDYSDLIGGVENITSYADNIVSTINPAISEATQRMLPCHKPSLTCATSLTRTSRWT